MTESVVETPVCEACGADVRKGSLYCYNCGGPVAPESIAAEKSQTRSAANDAWFRADIVESKKLETTRLDKGKKKKKETPVEEKPTGDAIPKAGIAEESGLRTAASLRRKGKTIERKDVEVIWEEPEPGPNLKFILATLVMLLVVIVIYLVASYFN